MTKRTFRSAPREGMVSRALTFAAYKHRDQRRKDRQASPYINHPIDLLDVLVNEGGVTMPEVLAAAVLHDTIEDTQTTAAELTECFGPVVTALVLEVTDDKALPKDVRKRLQVTHARQASYNARLLKLADKIANLRDLQRSVPADWSDERVQQYFAWAAEVLEELRGTHLALELAYQQVLNEGP